MKVTCAVAIAGMVGVSAFQVPMQARNLASRSSASRASTALPAVTILSDEEVRQGNTACVLLCNHLLASRQCQRVRVYVYELPKVYRLL